MHLFGWRKVVRNENAAVHLADQWDGVSDAFVLD